MKTLSTSLAAAAGLTITSPGHLVAIDFATPLYLSSLDQVDFDSHTFVAFDLKVSGFRTDSRGRTAGQITLGNADLAMSALILGEGVSDKRIRVWAFHAAATGAADIVPVFDGTGDSAEVGWPCVIKLVSDKVRAAYSPRIIIGPPLFNHLSPAGRAFKIGNDTMTLERG